MSNVAQPWKLVNMLDGTLTLWIPSDDEHARTFDDYLHSSLAWKSAIVETNKRPAPGYRCMHRLIWAVDNDERILTMKQLIGIWTQRKTTHEDILVEDEQPRDPMPDILAYLKAQSRRT